MLGRLQSMESLRVRHDWATSLSRIGEGNGNPLQCSCLENPRDGGAWWAAIYGVAQSRTRLKRLSSSSYVSGETIWPSLNLNPQVTGAELTPWNFYFWKISYIFILISSWISWYLALLYQKVKRQVKMIKLLNMYDLICFLSLRNQVRYNVSKKMIVLASQT